MATTRGESIEYGWFKDKTTSKLVELTQKLLHFRKLRGLLHFLPQLSNIFTQIYLPYLWHFATLDQWTNGPMDKKLLRPYEKKNTLEHWIIVTFEHLNIVSLEHWKIGTFDIQSASICILWHQLHWYCLSDLEWHL